MPQPERPARRTPRRWRIPPGLPREPNDPNLDALPVLEENAGNAGVLLWLSIHDVVLWANTPPDRRSGLFAPGALRRRNDLADAANLDPELAWAMRNLTELVFDPAGVDGEAIRLSCVNISRWADERGSTGTALWFAQAAALAAPESAQLALGLGRLTRRLGRLLQAETWLRRTIGIARRSGEWGAYTSAFVELGDLLTTRDDHERARSAYMRAVRASRRHRLPLEYRRAHIGLMRLALREDAYPQAVVLADRVRLRMPLDGAEHDAFTLVCAELDLRQGAAAPAAASLKEILLRPLAPLQRLHAASLLAHAAAAVGDRPTTMAAWDETQRLIESRGDDAVVAAALVDLAHAGELAGFRHKAAEAAERAWVIASKLADRRVMAAARAVAERLVPGFVSRHPEPAAADDQIEENGGSEVRY